MKTVEAIEDKPIVFSYKCRCIVCESNNTIETDKTHFLTYDQLFDILTKQNG